MEASGDGLNVYCRRDENEETKRLRSPAGGDKFGLSGGEQGVSREYLKQFPDYFRWSAWALLLTGPKTITPSLNPGCTRRFLLYF